MTNEEAAIVVQKGKMMMKPEEAIEILNRIVQGNNEYNLAMRTAIQALKKQVPQKAIRSNRGMDVVFICPCCGSYICKELQGARFIAGLTAGIDSFKFCNNCGQTITWKRKENEYGG